MKRIAVLGIGAMGYRMAQNLLKANYQVVVYNRTKEKAASLIAQGAKFYPTPVEAVQEADVVINMVTNNYASKFIWLNNETGAVLGLNKDKIAIESSTLTVEWVKELGTELESRQIAFLDAPVVGSLPQVEAGKLIYLIGGKSETLSQVQDTLLAAGGASIQHIGSIGQGMAMKLAVNTLLGNQIAALAEILGMLSKNGVTLKKALECLGELPVMSPAAKGAANLMQTNNYTPLFPIELIEKDLSYMIKSAQSVHAETPVSTAIDSIYQQAIAKGYGSDNITGVLQLFIDQ